jgi:hypothetical protein
MLIQAKKVVDSWIGSETNGVAANSEIATIESDHATTNDGDQCLLTSSFCKIDDVQLVVMRATSIKSKPIMA